MTTTPGVEAARCQMALFGTSTREQRPGMASRLAYALMAKPSGSGQRPYAEIRAEAMATIRELGERGTLLRFLRARIRAPSPPFDSLVKPRFVIPVLTSDS